MYIGQSLDIERRWKWGHIYALRKGCHINNRLQKEFDEYGENKFELRILEECEESKSDDKEIQYIKTYKTYNDSFGYNYTFGGKGGKPIEETRKKIAEAKKGTRHTEESRKKMSEAKKENPVRYWQGKQRSRETILKMSESSKGRRAWNKGEKLTEEHKLKLSEIRKEFPLNYWLGKHRSTETKKKLSDINNGKTHLEETIQKMKTTHQKSFIKTRNTSGYKGVSYDKARGKWMASVRGLYLGRFATKEAAARAYNEGALKYYGEHAYLNEVLYCEVIG